jgi:hypothetical protein
MQVWATGRRGRRVHSPRLDRGCGADGAGARDAASAVWRTRSDHRQASRSHPRIPCTRGTSAQSRAASDGWDRRGSGRTRKYQHPPQAASRRPSRYGGQTAGDIGAVDTRFPFILFCFPGGNPGGARRTSQRIGVRVRVGAGIKVSRESGGCGGRARAAEWPSCRRPRSRCRSRSHGRATYVQQALAGPHLALLLCGNLRRWDSDALTQLRQRYGRVLSVHRLRC